MLSASLKPYLIERKYSCKLWPWSAPYVHKLALRGTDIISISIFMATKIYRDARAQYFKTIFSGLKGDEITFIPIRGSIARDSKSC